MLHVSNAQEGKPTKEETIEYLENNFPKLISYFASLDDKDLYMSSYGKISNTSFDINDCIVTINYHDTITSNNSIISEGLENKKVEVNQYSIVFNINEIVSIGMLINDDRIADIHYKQASNGYMLYNYVFYAAKNGLIKVIKNGKVNMVESIAVPIGSIALNDGAQLDNFSDWQLYKAFNHLRKICGAKDPISFD